METHREKALWRVEAEIAVTSLQAQEPQGSPATARIGEAWNRLSLGASVGTKPADTWISASRTVREHISVVISH